MKIVTQIQTIEHVANLLVRSILAIVEHSIKHLVKGTVTVNPGAMVSRNRGQNVAQGDEDFIGYKEI